MVPEYSIFSIRYLIGQVQVQNTFVLLILLYGIK